MDDLTPIEKDTDNDPSSVHYKKLLEHFDDFTLASSWERFISEVEAVCRQWLADGPKNLLEKGAVHLDSSKNMYKVKSELKYLLKSYGMEYYFEVNKSGKVTHWDSIFHYLQLCFGVKEFLVIAPQSASGVVLDAPEASKLLSAIAIALSNCSSLWPAFIPVHDPSRNAYIGIQNLGTVFTRRFEADRICSQVPVKLMHLEGLYELFVSKFAYSTLDISMHNFKVRFTMKLTYQTLPYDDDDIREVDAENIESSEDRGGDSNNKTQWDDDCPWSEWYSAEDPVKGFSLIAIWSEKMVKSSLEMAELENSSPHEAEKWILLPNISDGSKGNRIGFASQLCLLVDALDMSFEAQFKEDFVSAVKNPSSDNLKSMVIPSPTVLDRVLKDLLLQGLKIPDFSKGEHKSSRYIKGAPLECLFTQFCLHSIWFGNCNIHAIAVLWIEFVREIRLYWEESRSLPKMPSNGSIDLSTCLIYQKLQMLAICIEKKLELNEDFQDCVGSSDQSPAAIKEDDRVVEESTGLQIPDDNFDRKHDSLLTAEGLHESGTAIPRHNGKPENTGSTDQKPSECIRRGSSGAVGSMMLLKSRQSMHAPFTQESPLMTEDMHEERLQAIEASGGSFTSPTSGSATSTGHPTSGSAVALAVTTPTITRLAQGNPPSPGSNLISLNASSQIPFKLAKGGEYYVSWKSQMTTLVFGYGLLGYVDGSHPCPPNTDQERHLASPGSTSATSDSIHCSLHNRQNNYKGKGGRRNQSGSNPPNPNHGRPGQSYGYSGQPSNFSHSSPQSNQSRQYPSNGRGFTSEGLFGSVRERYLILRASSLLTEKTLPTILLQGFSAQLEKDILSSDMSAFKAANPDAVFEDFIRWHSPGDWENDESEGSSPSGNLAVDGLKDYWPPRGRLSQRMSKHGNLWRNIWNNAPALPVSEQKPLLDPNREGEEILHYLETLRPHQLLEQMVCTAFRASADTLNQASFGGLKQMTMKIDQLYLTMASSLRPLKANNGTSETIEDLRRLCVVFEHVEKLLTLAASLHRKFLLTLATSLHRKFSHAPRLSEAIFSNYYNYYLPKMGMGSSEEVDVQKEFEMKLLVRNHERQVISNMFTLPTANQSWRKVLSMGNLLNGHEPILREIIFSMNDHVNGSHYATHTPSVHQKEIDTYRMYICGTSNDLRVALSVTSFD
ncbi:hypothetical protein EZV62_002130 [Acer yangbiense]|uniref:Rab3 GTPase-activating protein catalytic subunit n=1 Tax=Acer yangbiense TaxID=1000413 RepID=A0A5C7IW84_9ROSI|nr:hypothetical protein EZV62_002130 [Acer yangbiense]